MKLETLYDWLIMGLGKVKTIITTTCYTTTTTTTTTTSTTTTSTATLVRTQKKERSFLIG